ncbi:hypothetical protein D9611_009792 [Ephemerocybe angulata]|uniref:Uncharacterized protein n=1 Tax=Ephemerocybe angulata TaxID=980116 RepID=A0A8H5CCW1_9AGAR|nr:hypothetical protein D9611_009792 [Tulosesus angulatus]
MHKPDLVNEWRGRSHRKGTLGRSLRPYNSFARGFAATSATAPRWRPAPQFKEHADALLHRWMGRVGSGGLLWDDRGQHGRGIVLKGRGTPPILPPHLLTLPPTRPLPFDGTTPNIEKTKRRRAQYNDRHGFEIERDPSRSHVKRGLRGTRMNGTAALYARARVDSAQRGGVVLLRAQSQSKICDISSKPSKRSECDRPCGMTLSTTAPSQYGASGDRGTATATLDSPMVEQQGRWAMLRVVKKLKPVKTLAYHEGIPMFQRVFADGSGMGWEAYLTQNIAPEKPPPPWFPTLSPTYGTHGWRKKRRTSVRAGPSRARIYSPVYAQALTLSRPHPVSSEEMLALQDRHASLDSTDGYRNSKWVVVKGSSGCEIEILRRSES